MCPHTNYFNGLNIVHHLINKPVLYVDPARTGAVQIIYQLFICRRILIRVALQYFQQLEGLWFKAGPGNLFGIPFSLISINDAPAHQWSSLEHASTLVFKPLTIDSRIPEIDVR